MMTMRIEIIEHNSSAYYDTVILRDAILRKPLRLAFDANDLQKEASSTHIACYFQDELAGCLILKPDEQQGLKMRQVAVAKKYQGMGIGKALVEYSEQFACRHGFSKIYMHARATAVEFYLKLGYELDGEPFEEVNIAHRYMFKNIC